MEAARNLAHPLAELRARRFERECEELRPLGVAFILRRFGHTLDHAEAEDAVSEVVIRLHRAAAAGRAPENLRAVFFTSCRNAAIDQLRSRNARPTVPLEAVADAPADTTSPSERAEAAEDGARLREAIARMRPNYREAIVLRFGLGLTVPEIAARMKISLPAAKKLVLRSTNQIRDRLESISGERFCPEIRAVAERSLFGETGGEEADETAALTAHLEHCGSCRSFLARLHDNLHELGSGALVSGYAVERSGPLHHLAGWADNANRSAHGALTKLRLFAFRSSGALQPDGAGSAGALAGTGQKIAAICTAGAATTATCLATGLVGPGIGLGTTHQRPPAHQRPAPKVHTIEADRPVSSQPSVLSPSEAPASRAASSSTPQAPTPQASKPKHEKRADATPAKIEPAPAPNEQTGEEFGIEAEPQAAPDAESPSATASTVESSSTSTPAPAPSSGSSSGAGSSVGAEKFSFGG